MSNTNPFVSVRNIERYRKIFKANKEDEQLIDDIAHEYYRHQALLNLYENSTNPSGIKILFEEYTEASSKCEMLKEKLKYKMIGYNEYATGYKVFFESYYVEFLFEKNATDTVNLEKVANELYENYKSKED